MKRPDVEPVDCCCGHVRALHPYGGMCNICRRSCEKFHLTGEGHHWAVHLVFIGGLLLGAASIIGGLYALWRALGLRVVMPF